ncbi:flippase [Rossellomorea marisflavi]|uniref:flippase n=1 Tax=Rossellomorea marisflavi TaxID=189381 RepID=UPI00203B334A|nr:flippase [Rossellomorea marisflavi]MCM2604243.1 flippase [Rossellomorea marisflavi]
MLSTKNDFLNKLIDAFIGKGAFILFSLLFSLIATRLYGIETFGEYTFAFTLASILMILSKAGLDNGLIYTMPKTKDKYVSLSLLVNLIFSLLIIIVTFIFVKDNYIRFMLPLIWLLSVEQVFFGIYRAEGKIKEFFLVNGFFSMIIRVCVLLVLYYLYGDSPYVLALSVYFSLIVSNLIYFVQNRSKIKKIEFDFSFISYSLFLVLANLLGVLMGKVDIIMLGILSTKENVGIYQIVVQVTSVVSLILIVFSTVFAPKISEYYHQNNYEGIRKLYVKASRMLSSIGLLITIVLIVFSHFFLGIFGEDATKGSMALIYLSLGQLINISVGSVWTIMAMTGKPKLQLYANIIAFTTNIVLNYIFIPKYGMSGAAFASMITHFITNALGYTAVSKRFNIKAFKLF